MMSDSPGPWPDDLADALDRLQAQGRRRRLQTVRALPQHRVQVADRTYLNLASNDYLGLGCDTELHQQFLEAMAHGESSRRLAFTASASRLLGGEHEGLALLESLVAERYGHGRQALVFNSGYHANIGILPALTGREDLILSDRLVHASLVDGIRLCRAQTVRYRHNDMDHLHDLLARKANGARRIFIVTESLFSMDGDVADLRTLVEFRERFGAILYLDEAHAVGVRGPAGLGLAAELSLSEQTDILIGTFGKALASAGAYAVIAPEVREYLINTARPLIYTTAPPPASVAWTIHALRTSLGADDRRARLAERVRRFHHALGRSQIGSHIIPLVLGEDSAAVHLSQLLREQGYWVPPIRPPTVPDGTARLRFSLGASMDMDSLVALGADTLRLKEDL